MIIKDNTIEKSLCIQYLVLLLHVTRESESECLYLHIPAYTNNLK